MKKILVTGGAGFIGINFVKYMTDVSNAQIVVVDKFTYASNSDEFVNVMKIPTYCVDISDKQDLEEVFKENQFSCIVHFAAESHVDRSIKDCLPFVQSNIIGTINLLDLALKYKVEKFVQISTDEVFGEVPYPGKFNEYSNICPRNPYSASKAAAEHFVEAYGNTYKLPYIIINSSNNYGPWQNAEKFIPLTISRIMKNQKIPVYGTGSQVRDWIYVKDAVEAIYLIMKNGQMQQRYCIGGENEIRNIDLVRHILMKMGADESLIEYVNDRPGHDARYSMSIDIVKSELKWSPRYSLSEGLDETIKWMKKNEDRI
jgi:dTDP-glucose 4,6-dehydratase